MPVSGNYLDGKTSHRVDARLEVVPGIEGSLRLTVFHSEDTQEAIPLHVSDLRISSRLGNTPREIAFAEGKLFITDDHDGIEALLGNQKAIARSGFLHALETHFTLITAATLITILLVWALLVFGVPQAARTIAFQMPDFTSETLGSSLSILDQSLFEPSTLDSSEQERLLQRLEPYVAANSHLKPQIAFRSGMEANAFALPGGEIVLTDDLVRLAANDEELIAIFFHELGHLNHKHMTRRALQDSLVTLLIIFITGNVDAAEFLIGIPTLLLDLSYSRDFEREADAFAIARLQEQGIPLEHFSSIIKKLGEFYNEKNTAEENETDFTLPKFLSTHPPTEERVQLIDRYTPQKSP